MEDLKRQLRDLFELFGREDIPKTGRSQPVPRYREINELLAKKILKDLTKKPE